MQAFGKILKRQREMSNQFCSGGADRIVLERFQSGL